MGDPVVRLDRSRPFSEVHGESDPADPQFNVRYWQGGKMGKHVVALPFDSADLLVPDDGKTGPIKINVEVEDGKGGFVVRTQTYHPLYTPLMRQYLAAKIKMMAAQATAPKAEADEPVIEEPTGNPHDAINFASWLRGEVEYTHPQVREAAKDRFSVIYPMLGDLVCDLVLDRKMVPEDQVCPALRAYLPPPVAKVA